MADTATSLLENVKQLLTYYSADLISGKSRSELEQLSSELIRLSDFLREAAKKTENSEDLRIQERQIKKVVYEVEDAIDSWLVQAVAAKGKNCLWRYLDTNRLSLAKQIKSLGGFMVEPIVERYGLQEEPNQKLIREENVVGFEGEQKTIINYLKEETEELDVISIIGIPGLGKTTLAWKVYRSPIIESEFPTRIWVFVSVNFNTRNVFLQILERFTSQDMSSLEDDDLAQKVRAFLEKEKFLLVLDDLWSTIDWNAINYVLPKSNRRSKVLITSRRMDVGRHANSFREPHVLRFLTVDESWELLQLEAFGNLDNCPAELQEIGKRIATKCDKLPLTVIMTAAILKCPSQKSANVVLQEWTKVSEHLGTYVREHVLDTVRESYNRLPMDLRNCFLYLGVFPEDYEIPVWTLTRLWIAEGFIRPTEEQSLEETAEQNLEVLINSNLVIVGKKLNDRIKTCRVHDLIREFCISKAGIKEQNLFQVITEENFNHPIPDIRKCRRVCIHSQLMELLSQRIKGKHVRSFLCFSEESIILPKKYISVVPDSFYLLRVLVSKSFKISQFPQNITKLIHLRYLTLSCDNLKVLPKEVSELWKLQTLVVDTKSHTLEIEGSIWKMIQLRHLKTKAGIVLTMQGDGEASANPSENLQTLSRLSPEYCTEDVFERARYLKELGIRGRLARFMYSKSLNKLEFLENLKLVNETYSKSAPGNRLPGLPPLNHFPRHMKKLTLSSTFLDWTHMSTLGKIDTLEVLKLKDNAFSGKSWRAVDDCFRSLQFLLIDRTDLVVWEASASHFPKLIDLVLKNCVKLSKIPPDLEKSSRIIRNTEMDTEHVTRSPQYNAVKNKRHRNWHLRVGKVRRNLGCTWACV